MAGIAAITFLFVLSFPLAGQVQLVETGRIPAGERVSRIQGRSPGRLYMISTGSSERGWYDRSSGRTYRTGGAGWGLEALDGPRSVWSDALSVYIADRNNQRIVRYDTDLRPISDFQTYDTTYAQARFGYPIGVAVNGRGDMGVLDGADQELVVFDYSARYLFRVGRDPRYGVTFSDPVDVCVLGDDSWIILDAKSLVQIDAFGTVTFHEDQQCGIPRAVDADEKRLVTAGSAGIVLHSLDHREHQKLSVGMFHLSDPGAEIDDVLLDGGSVIVVLDGVPLQYRLEGFER